MMAIWGRQIGIYEIELWRACVINGSLLAVLSITEGLGQGMDRGVQDDHIRVYVRVPPR